MAKTKKTLYVAYGSNMNVSQMAVRCPDATVWDVGEIHGYELLFRGGRSSAVATIEPKKGGVVPVLLWQITKSDEAALDVYEGYPHLYRKETVNVAVGGKTVEAMVYVMNYGELGTPCERYYRTIAEGYETAGLDVAALRVAVENCERKAANSRRMALKHDYKEIMVRLWEKEATDEEINKELDKLLGKYGVKIGT